MRLAVTETVDGVETVINIAEATRGDVPPHLEGFREVGPEVGKGHVWNGSAFVPPQATMDEVKKALKARRKSLRNSGLTVPVARPEHVVHIGVDTARDDTSGLLELLVQARAGKVRFPVRFKGKGRFGVLHDIDDVETIASAVSLHVQACYEAEAEAVSSYETGAATSLEEAVSMFNSVYSRIMEDA